MDTIEELQQLRQRIDDSQEEFHPLFGQIQEAWRGFLHVRVEHPLQRPELHTVIASHGEGLSKEIASLQHEGAEALVHHFDLKAAALRTQSEHDGAQTAQHLEQWVSVAKMHHESLQSGSQQIEQAQHQWEEAQRHVTDGLEALQHRTQNILKQVTETYHAGEQNLQRWQASMQGLTENFSAAMNELSGQMLRGVIANGHSAAEQSHHEFASAFEASANDLETQLQQLVGSLVTHIGQTVNSRIEQEGQKLVQEVLTALVQEGQEAVIKTTLGAEITAALSPILPELIGLYKATGAIKSALKALKDLARGLTGGLFG